MSGFVKLDQGILNSTVWVDRDARDIFITSLLLAEPREYVKAIPQIEVRTLKETGWAAPPGWYGFVPAAGIGIGARAGVDREACLDALERMGSPEAESRSQDFEGRRLIRIDGGYLVLNYQRFRDRDYSAAERMRRFRNRQRYAVTRNERVTDTPVTQAEEEVEVEVEKTDTKSAPVSVQIQNPDPKNENDVMALQVGFSQFWGAYPRQQGKGGAFDAWRELCPSGELLERILAAIAEHRKTPEWRKDGGRFIPKPATWLLDRRWEDGKVAVEVADKYGGFGLGGDSERKPV